MSYNGNTFTLLCSKGGFTEAENVDITPPTAMVDNSKNLNINSQVRTKRGGTRHVNSAAFSGTPQIMGIYQFIAENLSEFTIVATKDGSVYKNSSTTIKTGLSTSNFFAFESFDDELFICDGGNVPQVWDGLAASTSDITSPANDWTANNSYPQWMIKHGRGNSERMWAFGCAATPNTVYASINGDAQNFVSAGAETVITLNINTGDGFGIVAAVEFGDRIICFGKKRSYIIDDSSTDTANWGYQEAQWTGGAANRRVVVKIPNDIIVMAEDGDIYSVMSAENYGDYKAASLSKKANINNWIRKNLNLSALNEAHAIYDPVLRAIKFFVVRSGKTQVDTALVYFIDEKPEEAWMIHQTTVIASPAAPSVVLAGLGVGNVDSGKHSYRVSFVNSYGDLAQGVVSDVVTTTGGDGQVVVFNIPTGNANVTARKIYRTVAGDTGEHLFLTTIADNSTTIFADNIADSSLGAAAPQPASGYNASAAGLIRVSQGNYQVYTGDYSGEIWSLEEKIISDEGNGFYAGFRTPDMFLDNPRATKNFKKAWVVGKPESAGTDLTIDWWVDGVKQTEKTLSMANDGGVFGESEFGTGVWGGSTLVESAVDFGKNGKRIKFEIYNSEANKTFSLSEILIDYKTLTHIS